DLPRAPRAVGAGGSDPRSLLLPDQAQRDVRRVGRVPLAVRRDRLLCRQRDRSVERAGPARLGDPDIRGGVHVLMAWVSGLACACGGQPCTWRKISAPTSATMTSAVRCAWNRVEPRARVGLRDGARRDLPVAGRDGVVEELDLIMARA